MPRLILCLVALMLASWCATGWARVIGTVQDARALHLRSGPGTAEPILATLDLGSEVSVEQIGAEWILVESQDGVRGYVHRRFLRLSGEAAAAETTPAATPVPTQTSTPLDHPTLGAEVTAPGGLASSDPPRQDATPIAAPPLQSDLHELRIDVSRLIRLTEELREKVDQRPHDWATAKQPVDFGEPPGAGPILAIAGAGALFGFVVGTLYGRRQERGRRSRVRL